MATRFSLQKRGVGEWGSGERDFPRVTLDSCLLGPFYVYYLSPTKAVNRYNTNQEFKKERSISLIQSLVFIKHQNFFILPGNYVLFVCGIKKL